MLEKSGYLVLPYGYESTLSGLKRRLKKRGTKKSRTVRRIRYSPDLLEMNQSLLKLIYSDFVI